MNNITLSSDLILSYLQEDLPQDQRFEVEELLLQDVEILDRIAFLRDLQEGGEFSNIANKLQLLFQKKLQEDSSEVLDISEVEKEEVLTDYILGKLDQNSTFDLEELLLEKSDELEALQHLEELKNDGVFQETKTQLDATFEEKLNAKAVTSTTQETTVQKKVFNLTNRNWWAVAASIALLAMFSILFFPQQNEPEYYALGAETEATSTQYQNILNTQSLLQNKLNRYLRFANRVEEEQRKAFAQEVTALCTANATVIFEASGDNIQTFKLKDFLEDVSNFQPSTYKIETLEIGAIEKSVFSQKLVSYKVESDGNVLKSDTSPEYLNENDFKNQDYLIFKVTIQE